MSKEAMRAEADRLIKEALEKKAITIKQGDTRIEAICGKWVMHTTCLARATDQSARPTASAVAPPIPASTSSKR